MTMNPELGNQDNFPLEFENQESFPLEFENQENFPLQLENQENFPLELGNQENFPLEFENQENSPLELGNQENFPLEFENQENSPLGFENQENFPLEFENQENFPLEDGQDGNPYEYVYEYNENSQNYDEALPEPLIDNTGIARQQTRPKIIKISVDQVGKDMYMARKAAEVFQVLKHHVRDEKPLNTVELGKKHNLNQKVVNNVKWRLKELGVIEEPLTSCILFKFPLDFDEMERFEENYHALYALEDEDKYLDKVLENLGKLLKHVETNPYVFVTKNDLNMKSSDVLLAKAFGSTVTHYQEKFKISCSREAVKLQSAEVNTYGFPESAQTHIDRKYYYSAARGVDKKLGVVKTGRKRTLKKHADEKDKGEQEERRALKVISGSNNKCAHSDGRSVAQYLVDQGACLDVVQNITKKNRFLAAQLGCANEDELERQRRIAAAMEERAERQREIAAAKKETREAKRQEKLARRRERRAKKKAEQNAANPQRRTTSKRIATSQCPLPAKRMNSEKLPSPDNSEVQILPLEAANYNPSPPSMSDEQNFYYQPDGDMFNGEPTCDQMNSQIENRQYSVIPQTFEQPNFSSDYDLPQCSNYNYAQNHHYQSNDVQTMCPQNDNFNTTPTQEPWNVPEAEVNMRDYSNQPQHQMQNVINDFVKHQIIGQQKETVDATGEVDSSNFTNFQMATQAEDNVHNFSNQQQPYVQYGINDLAQYQIVGQQTFGQQQEADAIEEVDLNESIDLGFLEAGLSLSALGNDSFNFAEFDLQE